MNDIDKKRAKKSAEFIKDNIPGEPEVLMILGSGLGDALEGFRKEAEINYEDIPYFKSPDVEGHKGMLFYGVLNGVKVLIMSGRLHYYEGFSMQEITFPVRVFSRCGLKKMIVTNAAGSVNTEFKPGDMVIITDHINLMGDNPLRGSSAFIDMGEAYSRRLIKEALAVSGEGKRIKLKKGVYTATTGPMYETPAEVSMVRVLGGDMVGMSTVPEVIAAKYCGLEVFGLSLITNMASGMGEEGTSHKEVLRISQNSLKTISEFLREFIARI